MIACNARLTTGTRYLIKIHESDNPLAFHELKERVNSVSTIVIGNGSRTFKLLVGNGLSIRLNYTYPNGNGLIRFTLEALVKNRFNDFLENTYPLENMGRTKGYNFSASVYFDREMVGDFQSKDLLWVKNVIRDEGHDIAYGEVKLGQQFLLHAGNKHKSTLLNATMGDLILLFQTLKNPRKTYLTHLVTPVGDRIETDNTSIHGYGRLVCAIAVANPITAIEKPDHLDFGKPNRGFVYDIKHIKDMKSKEDIPLQILQQELFSLFDDFYSGFKKELENYKRQVNDSGLSNTSTAVEGAEKFAYVRHRFYERDSRIVRNKKELAIRAGDLRCEVCTFNFQLGYGKLGKGFIECHHRTPLNIGLERETTLDDLALVCANCHRMLHRKLNGEYLTVEKLKRKVARNARYWSDDL